MYMPILFLTSQLPSDLPSDHKGKTPVGTSRNWETPVKNNKITDLVQSILKANIHLIIHATK